MKVIEFLPTVGVFFISSCITGWAIGVSKTLRRIAEALEALPAQIHAITDRDGGENA